MLVSNYLFMYWRVCEWWRRLPNRYRRNEEGNRVDAQGQVTRDPKEAEIPLNCLARLGLIPLTLMMELLMLTKVVLELSPA
mgnify:CR=1 FL=1